MIREDLFIQYCNNYKYKIINVEFNLKILFTLNSITIIYIKFKRKLTS